jgi:hypothetical protein
MAASSDNGTLQAFPVIGPALPGFASGDDIQPE